MKSVFRPLQALNLEQAILDAKKAVRCDMGVAQAKTCTEEKNACNVEAMPDSGTYETCQ